MVRWDLGILNRCIEGDEEGDFTYIGARNDTVIDYVIKNEKREEKLEVVECSKSDHLKMIVTWEENKGEGHWKV